RCTHQRLELWPPLLATRDGHIEVLPNNLSPGTRGIAAQPIHLEIRLLMDGGDAQVKRCTHRKVPSRRRYRGLSYRATCLMCSDLITSATVLDYITRFRLELSENRSSTRPILSENRLG